MSIISFQYLLKPFNRVLQGNSIFVEENAFPPPTKPYFKGTDVIPNQHPSKRIRSAIHNELGSRVLPEATYPGNVKKSELHMHTDICNQLIQAIYKNRVSGINSIFSFTENKCIYSVNPFASPLSVIPFNTDYFVIPAKCGFYNGDVFDFLKEKHAFSYDIVVSRFVCNID